MNDKDGDPKIYVVCRRGNDSQRAVKKLREIGHKNVVDMVGGMEAWAKEIDPTFPLY
jgi:adenylyltransferase/sulfurtransferase